MGLKVVKNKTVGIFVMIENEFFMYQLSEVYSNFIKKPIPTSCGIGCEDIDPYMAKLNLRLSQGVSCFSYTIIQSGSLEVSYDGKICKLKAGDLFISTPGMVVKTLSVSDEMKGICLMGEEKVMYEIPFSRNIISVSYCQSLFGTINKLSLSENEASDLVKRMTEIKEYAKRTMMFKSECIFSLYSLFILELLNIENRIERNPLINSRKTDIFLQFSRMLAENYLKHHDMKFYADKLAVTTIYLSRIVREVSGQTVKNHIDRFLTTQATFLLQNTDKSITEISDMLNFSNPSTFCRFILRRMNVSPRDLRKGLS